MANARSAAPPDDKADEKPSSTFSLSYFLARNLGILTVAALSCELYRLSMAPVFGSMEYAYHMSWEVNLVALVLITNLEVQDSRQHLLCLALPVLATAGPQIIDAVASCSQQIGPRWGPLVASLLSTLPLIYLSLLTVLRDCMRVARQYPDIMESFGKMTAVLILGALWFDLNFVRGKANVAIQFACQYFPAPLGSNFGLMTILTCISGTWAVSKKPPIWVISLVATCVILTTLDSHLPISRSLRGLNDGSLKEDGFSLLARQDSVTGYVSVLDNFKEGYRILRCDHSLLGGDWIQLRPNLAISPLQEPIYSAFVMLEAIRLIELPVVKSTPPKPDSEKSALIM